MSEELFAIDFEVFGIVQGVFFRKYTKKQAETFGLGGWCMNTAHGTVKGKLEGNLDRINRMKDWLTHKGSPHSRIDNVEFSEIRKIQKVNFTNFRIRQ